MIKQRDIRKFQVRFHRNGISGEGFHLCRFVYLLGAQAVDMQAIVFETKGQVAVTSEHINARWRGDEFEPAIREAIARVEQTQPETIHAHEFT